MANNKNMCVVCQDVIDNNDISTIPLPCMHTYHRECITAYVTIKMKKKEHVDCPVCRQVSYHYGTNSYDEFYRGLVDVKATASSNNDVNAPTALTKPPQVVVHVHQVIPFDGNSVVAIQQKSMISTRLKYIFASMLTIILLVITGVLVALYMK